MAKRRRRRGKGSGRQEFYLLRIRNPESLKAADAKARELRSYLSARQAALESQQAEHRDAIAKSLLCECRPFEFTRWQRRVSAKYSLQPLSARGSALHAIGGRFNVGRIDPDRYPPFPALYIAADQDTALQEALGGVEPKGGLTFRDLALQRTDSYAMYSLSGGVESALDLVDGASLQPYVDVIRTFRIPNEIAAWGMQLGYPRPEPVASVKQFNGEVMNPGWRGAAAHLSIPSGSQTFGRLARTAGIEAIRYRSVKSDKPCLVIFPENFEHSDSYVELDDPAPPEYPDLIRRLDRTSWPKLI